jgi:glycerol-3-phosphate dehydrogenase (NAD(P)+)
MNENDSVAVVGGGSWGTALAYHLGMKGIQVDLWVYEEEVARQIHDRHENSTYLPHVILPDNIRPSNNIKDVVKGKNIVIMVVPSHVFRSILTDMNPHLLKRATLVSAAKGIENDSLLTMCQVMSDVLSKEKICYRACLSGPSFAREVGAGLPTAITVACHEQTVALDIQRLLASPTMRVYSSNDLTGVELGGALKNVIAIGAGITDGLKLGSSARAALITRGLAEIGRLGVKMGANPLTFMGLAGMGDLVLTCTGDLSRNRTVGMKLGQGQKLDYILSEMKMVAEGVKTTRSVHDLSQRENVDMPISRQVFEVIYNGKDPKKAVVDLMTRDLKDEIDHAFIH